MGVRVCYVCACGMCAHVCARVVWMYTCIVCASLYTCVLCVAYMFCCAHMHSHACTQTHMHRRKHTCTQRCTHTCLHMQTHMHAHTDTRTDTHELLCTHELMHTHAGKHRHVYTCRHTHPRARRHTCTHIHPSPNTPPVKSCRMWVLPMSLRHTPWSAHVAASRDAARPAGRPRPALPSGEGRQPLERSVPLPGSLGLRVHSSRSDRARGMLGQGRPRKEQPPPITLPAPASWEGALVNKKLPLVSRLCLLLV